MALLSVEKCEYLVATTVSHETSGSIFLSEIKKTGVYKALNSDGIPAKVRHFSSKVFKKGITLTACPGPFISACHCDLLSHITPFRVDTRGSAASSRTTIARHLAQLVRYWKNNRNKGQY